MAYYPALLRVGSITGVHGSYGTFWFEIVRSGFGTAGPLWFLWLLLAFNLLTIVLYRVAPLKKELYQRAIGCFCWFFRSGFWNSDWYFRKEKDQ
jgi:hypothetical protein